MVVVIEIKVGVNIESLCLSAVATSCALAAEHARCLLRLPFSLAGSGWLAACLELTVSRCFFPFSFPCAFSKISVAPGRLTCLPTLQRPPNLAGAGHRTRSSLPSSKSDRASPSSCTSLLQTRLPLVRKKGKGPKPRLQALLLTAYLSEMHAAACTASYPSVQSPTSKLKVECTQHSQERQANDENDNIKKVGLGVSIIAKQHKRH